MNIRTSSETADAERCEASTIQESPIHALEMALRLDTAAGTDAALDRHAIWSALSRTPGVGVSITDTEGRLLFVNDTTLVLFEGRTDIEYQGKTIGDFHSPEFTEERLRLLRQVVETRSPVAMRHVFLGRRIESTLWPILDRKPPFNRVIVISRHGSGPAAEETPGIETYESDYIELGQLDVLTPRELEVFVMLGHGMSIPRIAKALYRSPKTLERHKTSIAKKLSLKNQAEMVRLVTMLGLDYEDAHRTRLIDEPSSKSAPDLPDVKIS